MAATWVVKPSASASPESSVLSLLEAALVDYIGLLGGTSSPTVNSPSRKGSSERNSGLRCPLAPMGHTSHFSPELGSKGV